MKRLAATLAAIAATGLISACGGASGPPAGSIQVTMTEFKFDPSDIHVKAGKLTFYLVNSGSVAHNMIIQDSSGTRVAGSELVSAGDTFVFTVDDLPAGNYSIVCDVQGHAAAGMKGTLEAT